MVNKKKVGEKRVYFANTSISLFIVKETQDRNSNLLVLGGRSSCRGHVGVFLTSCFSRLAQSAFL